MKRDISSYEHKLICDAFRISFLSDISKQALTNSARMELYARELNRGYKDMFVVLLDKKYFVKGNSLLTRGGGSKPIKHTDEILKLCASRKVSAVAIIFTFPVSEEKFFQMNDLYQQLGKNGITVCDVLECRDSCAYSLLREYGLTLYPDYG